MGLAEITRQPSQESGLVRLRSGDRCDWRGWIETHPQGLLTRYYPLTRLDSGLSGAKAEEIIELKLGRSGDVSPHPCRKKVILRRKDRLSTRCHVLIHTARSRRDDWRILRQFRRLDTPVCHIQPRLSQSSADTGPATLNSTDTAPLYELPVARMIQPLLHLLGRVGQTGEDPSALSPRIHRADLGVGVAVESPLKDRHSIWVVLRINFSERSKSHMERGETVALAYGGRVCISFGVVGTG